MVGCVLVSHKHNDCSSARVSRRRGTGPTGSSGIVCSRFEPKPAAARARREVHASANWFRGSVAAIAGAASSAVLGGRRPLLEQRGRVGVVVVVVGPTDRRGEEKAGKCPRSLFARLSGFYSGRVNPLRRRSARSSGPPVRPRALTRRATCCQCTATTSSYTRAGGVPLRAVPCSAGGHGASPSLPAVDGQVPAFAAETQLWRSPISACPACSEAGAENDAVYWREHPAVQTQRDVERRLASAARIRRLQTDGPALFPERPLSPTRRTPPHPGHCASATACVLALSSSIRLGPQIYGKEIDLVTSARRWQRKQVVILIVWRSCSSFSLRVCVSVV